MKPPAPGPVKGDSTTNDIRTDATAASTALPPARRTSAPAWAVSGCPAATTPLMGGRLAATRQPAKGESAARHEFRYVKLLGRAPRSTRDARLAVGRDVATGRLTDRLRA